MCPGVAGDAATDGVSLLTPPTFTAYLSRSSGNGRGLFLARAGGSRRDNDFCPNLAVGIKENVIRIEVN